MNIQHQTKKNNSLIIKNKVKKTKFIVILCKHVATIGFPFNCQIIEHNNSKSAPRQVIFHKNLVLSIVALLTH
jgi:hypothetical protein